MDFAISNIEVAELRTKVNKYYPGVASFYIESLCPMAQEIDMNVQRSKSLNKNDNFSTGKIVVSNLIDLEIPKDIVRDYKSKYIEPGTKFIVAFRGYDNTLPVIIGME